MTLEKAVWISGLDFDFVTDYDISLLCWSNIKRSVARYTKHFAQGPEMNQWVMHPSWNTREHKYLLGIQANFFVATQTEKRGSPGEINRT